MIKLGFDNDGDFVVASVKGEMCILKIDVDWFFNDEADDEVPCIMFWKIGASSGVMFPDLIYAVIKKEDFVEQKWEEDFYPEKEQ